MVTSRYISNLFLSIGSPPILNMTYKVTRPKLRAICDGCTDIGAASAEDIVEFVQRDTKTKVDEESESDDNWMDA